MAEAQFKGEHAMRLEEILDRLDEVRSLVAAGVRHLAPDTLTEDLCEFSVRRIRKGDGHSTLGIYNATCKVTTSGGLNIPLVKRFTDRLDRWPLLVEDFAPEVIRAITYIDQCRPALEGRRRALEAAALSISQEASSEGLLPSHIDIAEHPVDFESLAEWSLVDHPAPFRFDVSTRLVTPDLRVDACVIKVDDAEDLLRLFHAEILPEQREYQTRRPAALASAR